MDEDEFRAAMRRLAEPQPTTDRAVEAINHRVAVKCRRRLIGIAVGVAAVVVAVLMVTWFDEDREILSGSLEIGDTSDPMYIWPHEQPARPPLPGQEGQAKSDERP